MFHRIENNVIVESVRILPKDFRHNGVLYPLRQMWNNGAAQEVNALGWFQEIPTAKPEGDVVSLGQPVLVDGVPTQTWEVRSFTGEDLQAWRNTAQVSALDGLLVLDQYSMAAAYQAWTTDPARNFAERAFIDKAQTWKRMDAVLITAATAMGLTETQLDDLFRQGGA